MPLTQPLVRKKTSSKLLEKYERMAISPEFNLENDVRQMF